MTTAKFKNTEIGRIPEDWEVKTIGDVARIVGGGTPSTDIPSYWNGDIQWFTPAEITNTFKYIAKSERTISTLGLKNSSAKLLPKGAILLTTRATIGATAILLREACTNQGFQSLIVNKENSNEFIYYLLPLAKNEMLKQASGSTFPEISAKKLAQIELALPKTIAEQERIATALSSIDTLICDLDRTIEKKQNIRQGAMEQLLSGEKRLPGFKGEWKQIRLSDVFFFGKGKGLKKEELSESGKYKCILYGEIFTQYDYIVKSVVSKTDKYEGTLSRRGDILMPGSTTTTGIDLIKAVSLNENNVLLGGDVIILRPKDTDCICSDFMAYLISVIDRKALADVTQGTTIIHLHTTNMVDVGYTIPPTVKEQTAIANLLIAMDDEIAMLQLERTKYANIRSGMMDDLLSGTKRL